MIAPFFLARIAFGLLQVGLDKEPMSQVVFTRELNTTVHKKDGVAIGTCTECAYLPYDRQGGLLLINNEGNLGWINEKETLTAAEAYELFTNELRNKRNDARILVLRAIAGAALHRYSEAMKDVEFAITLNNKDPIAYRVHAFLYHRQSNYRMARVASNAALKLRPQDVLSRVIRAHSAALGGDIESAMSDFNEALRNDSNCMLAYCGRALVWQALKDREKASADVERARLLAPKNACPIVVLAIFRYRDGKINEAERYLANAVEVGGPSTECYIYKAAIQCSKGDFNKALTELV